jgi:hypothetical protein
MATRKSSPANNINQLHSFIILVALLTLIVLSVMTVVRHQVAKAPSNPGTPVSHDEESNQ